MTSRSDAGPPQPGALLRLMQLVSPSLPVGAFAYSQGLEWAVQAGWVVDETTAADWIEGLLTHSLAHLDVPVLARLYEAWESSDLDAVLRWSRILLASREGAELQAEDRRMGSALVRMLRDLELPGAEAWMESTHTAFATAFSLAAVRWQIPLPQAASGYLWAWAEHQVAAAIKLVPLGQTAGQRILSGVVAAVPPAVTAGFALEDADIGSFSPALAVASALHETQYTRLFRS